MSIDTFLQQSRLLTDAALDRLLPSEATAPESLHRAMRYSCLGDGKRIRPALTLAAAEAVSGNAQAALLAACAVEMIHAYSLIHDDLPAMDDDALRRGRPTCHIAFGEAVAILAGDALQSLAFEVLAGAPELNTQPGAQFSAQFSAQRRIEMVLLLARASGHAGMVGGQAIDLSAVGQALTLTDLEAMHRHKTGALIEASVLLGATCAADCSRAQTAALSQYSRAIGLAFQVQDDIIDVISDTATLGKQQGADHQRNKPTYPALLGLEGARAHLQTLLAEAQDALQGFAAEANRLRDIAHFVVTRHH